MNDLIDNKTTMTNNLLTPQSRFRRHRSLDLRTTKHIQKNIQSPLSHIYSELELEAQQHQIEKLCDEFEKMNDGSAYRRFLMSRLQPYIVDIKMNSARPILCDKCENIVTVSSCKTCDLCLSFYCHECVLSNFTRADDNCCFCGENRNVCNTCIQQFTKCSLCTTRICTECAQTNVVRKCKCGKKIYCRKCNLSSKHKPKCSSCKRTHFSLKRSRHSKRDSYQKQSTINDSNFILNY